MFDLLEILSKKQFRVVDNIVALKILENLKTPLNMKHCHFSLKPGTHLQSKGDISTAFDLFRMKLTSKLSKLGFDSKYFF